MMSPGRDGYPHRNAKVAGFRGAFWQAEVSAADPFRQSQAGRAHRDDSQGAVEPMPHVCRIQALRHTILCRAANPSLGAQSMA